MYTIKRFTTSHIDQSITLIQAAYKEEQIHHQLFFAFAHSKDYLKEQLTNLCNHTTYAYALYDQEKFIGFILGHTIPSLWGKHDGYYSPLHANFVQKNHRKKGYQLLYQHLSQELVANNILSHAITLFVNDDIAMHTWFHLGFGLRLIDSYKPIEQTLPYKLPKNINIHRVTKEHSKDLLPLQKNLHFYFEEAPLFMAQHEEDEEQEILDFIQQEHQFIYALYQDKQPVALIKLRETGENYLTHDKNSIHICGLYVQNSLRGQGIAKILLDYTEYQCHTLGYTLLGVDFESFNIKGAHFWNKYFTPYTYTLTRRIDEHILKRT